MRTQHPNVYEYGMWYTPHQQPILVTENHITQEGTERFVVVLREGTPLPSP